VHVQNLDVLSTIREQLLDTVVRDFEDGLRRVGAKQIDPFLKERVEIVKRCLFTH
jgi:hypothetical protein